MKILFLALNEIDSVNDGYIYADLIKEFGEHRHEVYAITPTRKEETQLCESEGVKIIKVKNGTIQKTGKIRKALNLLFLDKHTLDAVKRFTKGIVFDLIIAFTSSLAYTKTIIKLKKRYKAKVYLYLKDIFPQNALDLGMLKEKGLLSFVTKYYRRKEHRLYTACDYIGVLSENTKKYVEEHYALGNGKVEVNSNSVYLEDKKFITLGTDEKMRIRREFDVPEEKVLFFYGGNLGVPQGVDFILTCISGFERIKNCFLLIVGDGTEYKKIAEYIGKEQIKNTKLLPRVPLEKYDTLLSASDVALIFLNRKFTLPNFPSRMLSYMQAARPMICATDEICDAGDLAEENHFGYKVLSGDEKDFFEKVKILSENEKLREEMGENARRFMVENYSTKKSYEIVMAHFKDENIIN